jgi:hypothetical protein
VVKTPDKFSLSGSPGNGGVERCLQDQFGLLTGIVLTKVAQELKEPDVSWEVKLADTPKHPQVGFEQGKQALGPILVHVSMRVFFQRVIDVLVR